MDRAPKYNEAIERVRNLSQSTEKKDQARKLRTEVMLDNAKCAKLLVETLKNNPLINEEDFEAIAVSSNLVVHPEVTQNFIHALSSARDRVKAGIEKAEAEGQEQKTDLAKTLYLQLLPYRERLMISDGAPLPDGQVKLGEIFPLAIILEVETTQDYIRLGSDQLTSDGLGNYVTDLIDENAKVARLVKGNYVEFPYIIVKGITSNDPDDSLDPKLITTTRHEKAHAENSAFLEALRRSDKKVVWSKSENRDLKKKEVQSLIEAWGWEDPESKKVSSIYNRVLGLALSLAKDELLADFEAEGHMVTISMQLRFGDYPYFEKFGIKKGSSLYEKLNAEYQEIIDSAFFTAQDIVNNYRSFGLIDRIELFRWVLAQIPVEQWEKQLKATSFFQESNKLYDVIEYCFGSQTNNISQSEKSRRRSIHEKLFSALREIQDKPLMDTLAMFEEQLEDIKAA